MSLRHPWSLLGIAPTADAREIRKAYAERLKGMDVDSDVAGFAQLRQARDLALKLAKTMDSVEFTPDAASDEAVETTPAATESPRWSFAAPDLPGDWEGAGELATLPAEGGGSTMLERMAWAAAAAREAREGGVSGAGIPLTTIDPFTAPVLSGDLTGHDALGLRPGETPAERLSALLDPDGAAAGEPLTEPEIRQAVRALGTILDEALQVHVTRQQQIEDWLAETLARGWPRSAPLLEDAAAAFGWEREWRDHDARPAIGFLGARLRGYRFQQAVAQPDHKLHNAWEELTQPGPRPASAVLTGPRRHDIVTLLRGLRRNFPELESHFDAERVESWEKPRFKVNWWLVRIGIVAALIIGRLLLDK